MKIKRHVFLIFIFTILFFLSACQALSVVVDVSAQIAGSSGLISQNTADAISISSRAISNAAEEITPEQEYYIGRAVAANILGSYRIWHGDPALTTYLNLICAAITVNSPRPYIYNGYRVAILDSSEINAFATSGGHIFITRGLINAAKSEEALAAVIAHEIAHIQLMHSIRAIRTSRITQAIMITGTAATGAAAGMDVNELTDIFNETIGEIVQTLVNNGFSREMEFEADNMAMVLMAAAGYNPAGLIDILGELSSIGTGGAGFGRTHPTPASRIENAQASLANFNIQNTANFRTARFIRILGR